MTKCKCKCQTKPTLLDHAIRQALNDSLRRNNHNLSAVARELNKSRPTVLKHCRKFGLWK